MCPYIKLFEVSIPSYGLMIAFGVVFANFIAIFLLRKQQDFNDFIILEAYCFLGAFLGAKLLYIFVSFKNIDWSHMMSISYFNQFMQGGFVFYGGFIGGITATLIGGKVHGIEARQYIRNSIFLIPLIHAFGRIGCFMVGCCYGRPYEGFGAVVFPKESYAVPGIKLFPVQLVEAGLLMIISVAILLFQSVKGFYYTIELYLLLYGIARFILEKYRYDEIRGVFFGLSTSQWISIILIIVAVSSVLINHHKHLQQQK